MFPFLPFTAGDSGGGVTLGSQLRDTEQVAHTAAKYAKYVTVEDESGSIRVDVPEEWADVRTDFLPFAGGGGVRGITAAPDVTAFDNSLTEPGIAFGATDDLTIAGGEYEKLLDLPVHDHSKECTYRGRFDYSDKLYVGKYDLYTACLKTDAVVVVFAASSQDGSFIVLLQMHIQSDADLDALDTALRTFVITP
jgi:hypothetical protein